MTTLVLPSVDADVRSFAAAMMNRYGSLTAGWVQASGGMFIANQYSDFDEAAMPFGGFEYLSGQSVDGTAVFDSGEGVIAGAYVGKDDTTAVDLNPNSTDTYYLGYSNTGKNELIIGRAAEFDNGDRPDDPRVPLWDITTGNNGVIEGANDLRVTELRINVRNDGSAANADSADDAGSAHALANGGEQIQMTDALQTNGNYIYGLTDPAGPNQPVTRGWGDDHYIRGDNTDNGGTNLNVGTEFFTLPTASAGVNPVYVSNNAGTYLGSGYEPIKLRGATDAQGHNLRNVGSFSATTADVGGSPVVTDADGPILNTNQPELIANRKPARTPKYEIPANGAVTLFRGYNDGRNLWLWNHGTDTVVGADTDSSFQIYDNTNQTELYQNNSGLRTGSPIQMWNSVGEYTLALRNNSGDTIEASAQYGVTRYHV